MRGGARRTTSSPGRWSCGGPSDRRSCTSAAAALLSGGTGRASVIITAAGWPGGGSGAAEGIGRMLEGGGDLKREAGREQSRADRAPLLTPLQHFYRTSSLPCPYLPNRVERKLVTELAPRDGEALYNDL